MRSALTNTIFQDEMHNIYVKKIWLIRDLVKQSRSAMAELIAHMESNPRWIMIRLPERWWNWPMP